MIDDEAPRSAAAVRAVTPVRTVDLDWRSIAALLGAFAGLVALTGFLRSVPRTLSALAVAGIIALALDPVVRSLERRSGMRRGLAVSVVLAVLALVFAIVGWLLVPPAVKQARDLGNELPTVLSDLETLPFIGDDLARNNTAEKLERSIRRLPERLAGDTTPLERAALRIADGVVAAIGTLLLAVSMLLDGPRLIEAARRLLPRHRRDGATRIGRLVYGVVGHYVAGSLTVAGVAGVTVLVAGLLLGVPLTPLAAMWVALWDLIPQIGGAAGGIPFVLLGITQGAAVGIACAVFFVIYLQIENHILGPMLVGQAVQLSPPTTMIAALVGVSAGGVVGALLAVPLVGAAKAIYLEVRRPPEPGPPAGPPMNTPPGLASTVAAS